MDLHDMVGGKNTYIYREILLIMNQGPPLLCNQSNSGNPQEEDSFFLIWIKFGLFSPEIGLRRSQSSRMWTTLFPCSNSLVSQLILFL